jgi:lysophospholipase L1-like esterase
MPHDTTASLATFASAQPAVRVEYWQQRLAEIEAQACGPDLSAFRLVFVGDSITDFWLLGDDPWNPGWVHGRRVWDSCFAGSSAHNRAWNIGVSGDRTEHLLRRILPPSQGGLGQLDAASLNPEFFVLMVGINNSYAPEHPAADSVMAGIVAVMRALHAGKPQARILLQSLLPTSDVQRNAAVVEPVNARLAVLARSAEWAGCTVWLDLHPEFIDAQGLQIAHLFVDGLHPSEAGYQVWRDHLLPALNAARAPA